MSSELIERWPVVPLAMDGAMVADPLVLWPRPRAWPYSWQATDCRSNWLPPMPLGPSAQVQLW